MNNVLFTHLFTPRSVRSISSKVFTNYLLPKVLIMNCPFQSLGIIGKGSTASAFRVVDKHDQKFILKATNNIAELDTLTRLRHPNIIRALDIIYDPEGDCDFLPEKFGYTMEIGGVNLLEYIKKATELERKSALYQILLAFRFLSIQGVVHGDYFLGNVILMNGRWVLIDFAACEKYYDTQSRSEYIEVIKSFPITPKISKDNMTLAFNDLDLFLSSEYFDGIHDPNDFNLGSTIIPQLPFIDNSDTSIGRRIHDIIKGNKVPAYCLIFDLCYRFMAATGELLDDDISIINCIVDEFYHDGHNLRTYIPPRMTYDIGAYMKIFDYILYRPNIYTYATSEQALLELGSVLRSPYDYTKSDLKVIADDINYKYESEFFFVPPEFTDLWFP